MIKKATIIGWPTEPEKIAPFEVWLERYSFWRTPELRKLREVSTSRQIEIYNEFGDIYKATYNRLMAHRDKEVCGWTIVAPTTQPKLFLIKHFCDEERFMFIDKLEDFNKSKIKKCQDCWSLGRKYSKEKQIEKRREWLKLFHAYTRDGLIIDSLLKEENGR